jgi:hypothetical protein
MGGERGGPFRINSIKNFGNIRAIPSVKKSFHFRTFCTNSRATCHEIASPTSNDRDGHSK